jgi:rod shape-determining protein MreB and related proteins
MSLSIFSKLRRAISNPDVAIDLGTANTRVYALGCGLLADEPSVVKSNPVNGTAKNNGENKKATTMRAISPLRGGVIVDVDSAVTLLIPLLQRARRFGLLKPRTLACIPTDASEQERAALIEATERAGASYVVLTPEPLAAAIGAGLDISSPYAQMIVDIGDGVTDIAVIRYGVLLKTSAVRTACSDLHAAVQKMLTDRYNILAHPGEAERLTREVGAEFKNVRKRTLTVVGTHCSDGNDATVSVTNEEVIDSISPPINIIVRAVNAVVRDLPLKVSCEVIENGICLTGGGAALRGLPNLLAAETVLDVRPAVDPLHTVINGACQMLASGDSSRLWAVS